MTERHLPRNLPRLTIIRGPAALLVFVYHINHDTNWLPTTLQPFAGVGYLGVALFFVLSGFVLTWSTPAGRTPGYFWLRRFARVYPNHIVTAVIALLLPITAFDPTFFATLANITLTQAWFPQWSIAFSLTAVSWSLSCEAFFYLIAPFIISYARKVPLNRALLTLSAWYALSLFTGGFLSLFTTLDIWAYTNPAIRSGEFALGIAAALAIQAGWRPRIPFTASIALSSAALLVLSLTKGPQAISGLLIAPVFLILIVSAAAKDIEGPAPCNPAGITVLIGEVSFAFYLVHEMVILNAAPFFPVDPSTPVAIVAIFGTLFVASALAWALHRFWEIPLQRTIIKIAKRSEVRSPA